MTLMPVSSMTFFGSRSANGGGVAVDRPACVGVDVRRVGIERLAEHVVDVAEDALADRAP